MNIHSLVDQSITKLMKAKAEPQPLTKKPRVRASAKPLFDPERRVSILQAALRVFVKKGFQRSTIRDIARAADLAEGTIYNHFDNKAALLIGLIEQLQSQRREAAHLDQIAAPEMPTNLEQFLPGHLALMLGERDGVETSVMGVLLAEMLADEPMRETYAKPLFEPVFAAGTAAIGQWTQQKLLRKTRPELTSRLVGALLLGLKIQNLLGDKVTHKYWHELPDAAAQLVLRGIKKS
ncbi:MAG: TetR/AcrR family transcriptional regulator [Casimicrobium sp.]